MAKRYRTYVVASSSGTLYVGMTNDIFKRVCEHKNQLVEGFTAKYDCTRLVRYGDFAENWGAQMLMRNESMTARREFPCATPEKKS